VDSELEVIRDEMEQTRANLADKLGALETQVRETVSGATEAVSSTVEGVKDVVSTVSETVESVTETFNVSKQIEQHPWAALGMAVVAGFVAAQLFDGSSRTVTVPVPVPPPAPPPPAPELHLQPVAQQTQPVTYQAASPPAEQHDEGESILHSLREALPDFSALLPDKKDLKEAMNTALTGVGSLAVGTLMGVVREMAVNGLPPEWQGELAKMVDNVNQQLGGRPLQPLRDKPQPAAGNGTAEQHHVQAATRQAEGAPFDPQQRQPQAGQVKLGSGQQQGSDRTRGALQQSPKV